MSTDGAAHAVFLEFWRHARAPLLRTCKSVASGNLSDAEDLLATVACRAWEQFPRRAFDLRSGIAWCRAVARNLAADSHRARVRYPHEELEELEELEAPDPERAAMARRLLRDVAERLRCLPAAQRAALQLRCVDGESYGGVARGLCTTELNARKLVQLARRSLRAGQRGNELHDAPLVRRSKAFVEHERSATSTNPKESTACGTRTPSNTSKRTGRLGRKLGRATCPLPGN